MKYDPSKSSAGVFTQIEDGIVQDQRTKAYQISFQVGRYTIQEVFSELAEARAALAELKAEVNRYRQD